MYMTAPFCNSLIARTWIKFKPVFAAFKTGMPDRDSARLELDTPSGVEIPDVDRFSRENVATGIRLLDPAGLFSGDAAAAGSDAVERLDVAFWGRFDESVSAEIYG
jgi:hypothetical protein